MRQKISKADWLRFHGFGYSPFDDLHAEAEFAAHSDIAIRAFVEPDCFQQLLGSIKSGESTILFSEPGMGKTMCRFLTHYYYSHSDLFHQNRQYVLSVPHTHLSNVVALARVPHSRTSEPEGLVPSSVQKETSLRPISLAHHLFEIMNRLICALTERVIEDADMRDAIMGCSEDEKAFIADQVSLFSRYLDFAEYEFWQRVGIAIGQGAKITDHASFIGQFPHIEDKDLIWLLCSLEQITHWLQRIGIQKIYILVDGLEQIDSEEINGLLAMDILRPILANLGMLIQTQGLIFKLFLPAHLRSFLLLDPGFSIEDQVSFLDLTWREDDILKILWERLAAYKEDLAHDRTETSLDLLCAPDLRGRIEGDLLNASGRNPRRLLEICAAMIENHCAREQAPAYLYWLTREDWKAALAQAQTALDGFSASRDSTLPAAQVYALIKSGENSELEFKSSARWDYVQERSNKVLMMVIAKSIAGMMNSNGGRLLIGVRDDGAILGIDKDLSVIKYPTTDAYELSLIDILKEYIGLEYIRYIKIDFLTLEQKTICLVDIRKSSEPVFLKNGDSYEFWVRAGNSTRSLNLRSCYLYLKQHGKL